jgi:hypothetical protein
MGRVEVAWFVNACGDSVERMRPTLGELVSPAGAAGSCPKRAPTWQTGGRPERSRSPKSHPIRHTPRRQLRPCGFGLSRSGSLDSLSCYRTPASRNSHVSIRAASILCSGSMMFFFLLQICLRFMRAETRSTSAASVEIAAIL